MVYGHEKPLTRRGRLIIVALLWVIGVPFYVMLWLLVGWWMLPLFAGSVWWTWDYVKRGGMFEAMDGRVGPLGWW